MTPEVITETPAETIARLEASHAPMVVACRKASDRLAELHAQHSAAQIAWQNSEHDAREIEVDIADHYRDKPKNFPLPHEIADWQSKLVQLKADHAKAISVTGQKWAKVEALRAERRQLVPQFENLKWQERELRRDIAYRREKGVLPAA